MYVFGHVKITDVNYSRTSLPFQGLFVDTRIKVVAHPIFLKDASAFKSSSKRAIITYTNYFSALQKMTKQYCTLLSTISLLFNFSSEIHLYTLWSEVRHRGEGGSGGYSPLLFDKNAINLPMSHQSNFFLFVLSPPPTFFNALWCLRSPWILALPIFCAHRDARAHFGVGRTLDRLASFYGSFPPLPFDAKTLILHFSKKVKGLQPLPPPPACLA